MTEISRFVRIADRLDWIIKWLGYIALGIAAALAAFVFALLCLAVITRPWSNFIFSLSFEIGGILMWPIAFLPLAAVWRTKGHVRFDLALRLTRGRAHHVLELLGGLLVLAIMLPLTWQAIHSFEQYFLGGRSTLTFRYPIWPAYFGVVAGCIVLALELVSSIYASIRQIIHPTGSEEDHYRIIDSTMGTI